MLCETDGHACGERDGHRAYPMRGLFVSDLHISVSGCCLGKSTIEHEAAIHTVHFMLEVRIER